MSEFVVIDAAGHRLAAPAAASLARMRASGMPGGNVTSALRTRAEQERLYNLYLTGKGNFALKPGTSVHEQGYAVDFTAPQYGWLASHGGAHGWRKTNPNERWHYEYSLVLDRNAVAQVVAPQPIELIEEDEMRLVLARLKSDSKIYVGDGISRRWVTSQAELADIQSMMRADVLKGDPTVHYVDSLGWLGKEL